MQIARFTKFNDNDDPMSARPPINYIDARIVWVENRWVNTLIKDPPTKYPMALTKNIKEKDVYVLPVAYAK